MSSQNDLTLIKGIIDRLDNARVSRFAYTQAAFDNDDIESPALFNYNADQNIPSDPEANARLLDKGMKAQGASIAREGWNHFIGRLSFNSNKLVERMKMLLGLTARAWAHNAFEYDASAQYAPLDVCYVVETVAGVKVYTYYQRTSTNPPLIQNIPPNVGTHWTEMQNKTSTSALLPHKAPGYQHKYTIVDLTSGFVPDTWYPVITTVQDFEAEVGAAKEGILQVVLEAYCNGPVYGLNGNWKAEIAVIAKFSGFAETSTDLVMDNSFVNQSDGTAMDTASGPIGFSKLPKGRQAIIWLKGGSKYALWNSFGSNFNLVTGVYNNQLDAPVTPVSYRPFAVNIGAIQARVKTPDAESAEFAVNLGQVEGSIPLPVNLTAGAQLDSVRSPKVYVTPTVNIANSIGNVPVQDPGIFELRVEGDKAGVLMTVQRFTQRSTGDEYTRVLSGSVVIVPWYKSGSPDGLYIAVQGLYAFQINNAGHLILHYQTGTDVPAFHIDSSGHLIAEI